MEKTISLLLADDHALFRSGVAELLRSTKKVNIVGQASNGEEAVRKARDLRPDVILMDVQMPVCNGVDAVRYLREDGFAGSVLMLTVSENDQDLFAALKNGANGYLLKNAEVEELISAVAHAARGETVISPVMATKLIGEFKSGAKKRSEPSAADALSEREEEILKLVAGGATNKDIGAQLFITENTVKCHMHNIMSKLHFKSRYQVITYAVKRGQTPA
jgi:two-component system NarL family response regulator